MGHVVDIMRLKFRSGASEAEILKASDQANGLFTTMPGLLRRALLGPDKDGFWVDTVEYDSLPSAEQSAKTVHEKPGVAQAYFALVDMPSLTFQRLTVRGEAVG